MGSLHNLALAVVVALFVGSSGCTHWVVIRSIPSGATARIDGEPMGQTPFFFEETTGWSKVYLLELEKEGFEPFKQTLEQDDLKLRYACPAVCLCPMTGGLSLGGCLFSYGLADDHTFVLIPQDAPGRMPDQPSTSPQPPDSPPADVPRSPPTAPTPSDEVVPF